MLALETLSGCAEEPSASYAKPEGSESQLNPQNIHKNSFIRKQTRSARSTESLELVQGLWCEFEKTRTRFPRGSSCVVALHEFSFIMALCTDGVHRWRPICTFNQTAIAMEMTPGREGGRRVCHPILRVAF